MTDLTDWLAEQHAADERVAREASDRASDWYVEEGRTETWDSPHRDPAIIAGGKPIITEDAEYSCGGAVEHIARHDPQSTLARIEAERMLVALHRPSTVYDRPLCDACWGEEPDESDLWPCPTLRALAWGYRHREGYDAAWAPDGVSADA